MLIDGKIVTRAPKDRLTLGPRGVRTHSRHKCRNGYTLYSTAFGDTEYLIDMNGMVVQTWPVTRSQYAEIRPSGNLMAGNYGSWVEEITPQGEQIWKCDRYHYHHDFHVVSDEEVVLLIGKRPPQPVPPGLFMPGAEPDAVRSDFVVSVDRKGDANWEFAFVDHLEEFHKLAGLPLPIPYARMQSDGTIVDSGRGHEDWAHCNTIEVLPDTPIGRKDERFRAGNILFSFRALDIIGVADVEKNKVTWAWGLGVLDGQHQPTMTPEGTILIFDNGTARGYSAAVEIDPTTNEEVWRYEDRAGFYSPFRAGVQRLPNGNTLIAESDAGRIFEVTPEKEVVWDYLNPFLSQKPGSQGLHVYRATRYAYDDPGVVNLLAARADENVVAVGDSDRMRLTRYGDVVRFYREGSGG
jgi:hypothetical protein